jgi:hypothetical protein
MTIANAILEATWGKRSEAFGLSVIRSRFVYALVLHRYREGLPSYGRSFKVEDSLVRGYCRHAA